ncbi:MAG: glycosyltransferase [Phaeovulum sp.]|uniref:glycosyltransferase family 2 protein n=1 Tax=Phaeovulum sp. TaxID=2934796 RepID=UPI002731241F|nr:glycosyltransferase [Phaeovulum sp.]MDP2063720.1 glycosyltransferase [Phaeovulum sp.]
MPRSDAPASPAVEVLQAVLSAHPGAPDALYFAATSARVETGAAGALVLPEGGVLSTDSYFNAFFLDFWRARTPIARLGVACIALGPLALRAVAHLPGGGSETLASWHHEGQRHEALHWVWARKDAPGTAAIGRIHLEVEAPPGTVIESLAYVTDLAPPNPVTLSVGLCTFEREIHFEKTVEILHALLESADLARVHVVNQGRSFHRPRLLERLRHPAFSVIEQANLGGTGGFCRAMLEASGSAEQPTHLLIMDDDIELDPRIVLRAKTFASYAVPACVIGGQAIELESRTRLQEVGGLLGPDWMTRTLGRDADLAEPATLEIWDQSFTVDYNAWWFCLMPMAAIARCGLPAPVFLHGDDIEYGCRLGEAGIEIVPLPGLGVWHSSFRYKHAGQISYYDLRNMLINAASHPNVSNLPGPVFVLGWVMHGLLVHRYRAALSSMIALDDFLAGPDAALGPDGLSRHLRLCDQINAVPPPVLRKGVVQASLTLAPAAQADPSVLRQAVLYFRLFWRILLWPTARAPQLLVKGQPLPENTLGHSYLLATGPGAEHCLVLRPRRLRLVAMTVQALWLALRYGLCRRAAARRWLGAIDSLRAPAHWEREFARARE